MEIKVPPERLSASWGRCYDNSIRMGGYVMITKRSISVILAAFMAIFFFGATSVIGKEVLHVYNWSDYMDEGPGGPVSVFEKQTGIDVTYDVFDSNEVLEAKLLAGKSGYDVVFPSTNFIGRQINAGVFQKLDRSKLKNYKHLDKNILRVLESVDPGNQYSIPYMWGTTGLGYNVKKVQAAFGGNAPVDSWDMIFKPENADKLKECGLVMLDDPSEILSLTLHYLGLDPNSMDANDYKEKALPLLMSIRPYIKYFHSSQYINDLANGDICAVIGWSGDILQARDRAAEAGNGVEIAYNAAKEGAQMWFDQMAIPVDAPNPEGAHVFLNFIMDAQNMADASNYVYYANGNLASQEFVDPEALEDTSVYPDAATLEKLFTTTPYPAKVQRVVTRLWTKIKSGT